MERTIQEVARLAGTTSRTLRHYDAIGLLRPSGVGANGQRRYDDEALVRLQRILLLRELGLGLPAIGEVLAADVTQEQALTAHLGWLRRERERLARQIASVERTIASRREGEELRVEDMFDGFDHTAYADEVTERWGADAYARGDRWWRGMDAGEKARWRENAQALARDWIAAAERGEAADGPVARDLAERHVAWLGGIPGTPAASRGADVDAYVLGLADLYVADPRFADTYATSAGGVAGAEFVRDALRAYVSSPR